MRYVLLALALASTSCSSSDDSSSGASGGSAGTSGSGGSAGSSAGSGGGGTGGGAPPIVAPNEEWTWIDVPGSKCGNGSETGFAVNLTDRSDKVAFHFMGGGACWDELTCDVLGTAVFIKDGFPGAAFASQQGALADGMFDRDDPTNPFADHSFIFVPYCTGDVHSGSNPNGPTGKAFVGFDNFGLYLDRVSATFDAPSQVVVTGSSAGGFGTLTNFARIADAFTSSDVVMVDDSGPPMRPEWLTEQMQQQTMGDAWGMEANLPKACPNVKVGTVHEIYECLADEYPNSRFGLIATLQDNVILTFYRYGKASLTSEEFEAGTNDIADTLLAPLPNWKVFFFPGNDHTYLMSKGISTTPVSGTLVSDWIRALLDDDSSWDDVRPGG